jgi:hypothetical protein
VPRDATRAGPGVRGCGAPWSCPGLVLVPRRRRPVGVQDQGPAPPVNRDLVMEPAQQHAVLDGRGAAVGLVPGVVHLARLGGLVAPPGPLAVLVAQHHRVADPRRDGLGVADVQRQARPAQPHPELPAAQERGEPAGAGQQVDGLADHRLLERGPGRVPRAIPPGVQFHAQPDQVPQRLHVDIPGHDRRHRRVTRDALGGVPVQPYPAGRAGLGCGRAAGGPPGPDVLGPLLLQRRAAVEPEQVRQGDVRPHLMGHMAVTASPYQGAEPSVKMAGLPARSMSSRSWAHDARAEIGRVWRIGRCREPVPYTRGYDPCDEIRVPAPAGRYRGRRRNAGPVPGKSLPVPVWVVVA